MTNLEIIENVNKLNIKPDVLNRVLKNHHPELFKELVDRTTFLDEGYFKGKSVPILARMYCLEHSLSSNPTCHNPNCNNPTEWRNGSHVFADYCCRKCYLEDPNSHRKEEEAKLKKYGDAHFSNPSKSKQTRKDRYGDENYTNREKFKETCQKRYGGNAPACSSEVVSRLNYATTKDGCDSVECLRLNTNRSTRSSFGD